MKIFIKRTFDIITAFMGIVLTSPLLLIISIMIKLTSKGSIIFKQNRVGKDGKLFKIYKFRTMVVDADKKGMGITVGKDKRITGIGKFLRKTKLDELPQLFNIILGNMSLVGPRPEVPEYVKLYNEEQRKVLCIKPGMTDYASICFRNESEILALSNDPEKEYIEKIMPLKIRYNLKYINEIGLFADIKILFLTLYVVCGGKIEIKI